MQQQTPNDGLRQWPLRDRARMPAQRRSRVERFIDVLAGERRDQYQYASAGNKAQKAG